MVAGRTAGRVTIEVVPDSGGFRRRLLEDLRRIEATTRATVTVTADLDTGRLRAQLAMLRRQRVNIPFSLGGRGAERSINGRAGFIRLLGAAAVAATPTIVGLGNALGVMSQAAAAGPAAFLTLASTVGVASFAFTGLGEQLEKLKKTGRGPSYLKSFAADLTVAQSAARGLRGSVQAAVLPAVGSLIRFATTGRAWSVVTQGMTVNARAFATGIRSVQSSLANTAFLGNMATAFRTTAPATQALVASLGSLARIFAAFAAGAGPVFARWMQNLDSALTRLAASSERLNANGSIARWAQQGGAAVASFMRSVWNLGNAIRNIFAAGQSGASFLAMLERGTAALRAWSASAEGQKTLSTVFSAISSTLSNIGRVIASFGPAIGPTIEALSAGFTPIVTALANAGVAVGNFVSRLSQMSGYQPVVAALAAAFLVFRVASVSVRVLSTALGALRVVFGVIGRVATQAVLFMISPMSTLISVGARLAGMFRFVGTAIGALRNAWIILRLLFLANPFGMVITAITLLGTALVAAYKHSETFRNAVSGAWAAIQSAGAAFLGWVQGIPGAVQGAFASLGSQASSLQASVTGSWNRLTANVSGSARGMLSSVSSAFTTTRSRVTSLSNSAQTSVSNAWNRVRSGVTNAVNGARSTASSAFSSIRSTVSSASAGAQAKATSAFNGLKNAITAGVNGALSAVRSRMSSIASSVGQGVQNALARARSFVGSFTSVGANIIAGIRSGVISAAKGLAQAAANAVKGALSAAKNAIKIKSPSRSFRDEVGVMIPRGAAVGVEKDAPILESATIKMVKDAVRSASGVKAVVSPDWSLQAPDNRPLTATDQALLSRNTAAQNALALAQKRLTVEQKQVDLALQEREIADGRVRRLQASQRVMLDQVYAARRVRNEESSQLQAAKRRYEAIAKGKNASKAEKAAALEKYRAESKQHSSAARNLKVLEARYQAEKKSASNAKSLLVLKDNQVRLEKAQAKAAQQNVTAAQKTAAEAKKAAAPALLKIVPTYDAKAAATAYAKEQKTAAAVAPARARAQKEALEYTKAYNATRAAAEKYRAERADAARARAAERTGTAAYNRVQKQADAAYKKIRSGKLSGKELAKAKADYKKYSAQAAVEKARLKSGSAAVDKEERQVQAAKALLELRNRQLAVEKQQSTTAKGNQSALEKAAANAKSAADEYRKQQEAYQKALEESLQRQEQDPGTWVKAFGTNFSATDLASLGPVTKGGTVLNFNGPMGLSVEDVAARVLQEEARAETVKQLVGVG